MSVAKIVEIIASSEKSFDDAVRKGVARATETVSDIASAWVQDQNVLIERGKVVEYRVTLKVTFVLKDKKK